MFSVWASTRPIAATASAEGVAGGSIGGGSGGPPPHPPPSAKKRGQGREISGPLPRVAGEGQGGGGSTYERTLMRPDDIMHSHLVRWRAP